MKKRLFLISILLGLSVSVQNVFGQTEMSVVERNDFPATTLFSGVNLQVSLNRLWRFEPFVEVGQHAQFSRGEWYRRIIWQDHISSLSHYNPDVFTRSTSLRFGTDFRITASDHIRILCHYRMPIAGGRIRVDEFVFMAGYVRKQNLTERASLDISISYGILASRRLMSNNNVSLAGYDLTSIETGVRLNYNITPSLKLNFCIRYLAKLGDEYRSTIMENIERTTRNIVTISVGLHYRIPLSVDDIQPRQRALPCPPAQHIRPRHWERPPTIFNHPSNPRRNR